jgi:hypothetical protein
LGEANRDRKLFQGADDLLALSSWIRCRPAERYPLENPKETGTGIFSGKHHQRVTENGQRRECKHTQGVDGIQWLTDGSVMPGSDPSGRVNTW